jgi:diguanylate cyclase (GGDEF)-like protein
MKPDFYDRSKRAHIYNSIYIYKVVSLVILAFLTALLGVLFHKYKALFHEMYDGGTPIIFIVMATAIVLFVFSILLDFYVLGKTASIGRHLNRLAYLDKLTGLPNRYSCDLLIESFNAPNRLPTAGFLLFRINNLVSVNSDTGHDIGNFLIAEFCSMLEDISQEYGYVGRNGGNEFIVLMDDCDSTKLDMFLMDLTKRIHGYNELNVGAPLIVAYSKALNFDEKMEKISDLISLGYTRLKETPQILS